MPIEQSSIRNNLLRLLSPTDFGLIRPLLGMVHAKREYSMIMPDAPIDHLYFPQSAVASVVAMAADGRRIEVGIIGREGFVGTPLLLGVKTSPHETYVQLPGDVLRVSYSEFRAAFPPGSLLYGACLKYIEAFNVQVAHTALSHGAYNIEQRLARWLLMCHDRLDGDDLPIIHEFLALMLGVRRSGVTEAVQVLEGKGFIIARRGLLTVLDRKALETHAGYSYGTPEDHYRKIFGQPVSSESRPPRKSDGAAAQVNAH